MKIATTIALTTFIFANSAVANSLVDEIEDAIQTARDAKQSVARIYSTEIIRQSHIAAAIKRFGAGRSQITAVIKGTKYKARWFQGNKVYRMTVINEGPKKKAPKK